MPGATDVQEKLLEVLDLEADRLLIAAKAGPLEKGDAVNLSFYLRCATDASKAEIDRIKALNPETLNDELLARFMRTAGIEEEKPNGKRKRSS